MMDPSSRLAQPQSRRWTREPTRWLLAGAGVVATALGAIGAVLPGLPTTIFLIIASYCFARSCPWLEQRLLRNRLFAHHMAWVDGRAPMSRRGKAGALAAMWTAVATSLLVLQAAGRLAPWLAVLLIGAAAVGTAAIVSDITYRLRARREALPADRPEFGAARHDLG
jgi:uncharacterized protein